MHSGTNFLRDARQTLAFLTFAVEVASEIYPRIEEPPVILSPLKEIDIYGVFMPPLLLWAALALVLTKTGHGILARRKFYHSDNEQQFFDMALFVILLSFLSFFIP